MFGERWAIETGRESARALVGAGNVRWSIPSETNPVGSGACLSLIAITGSARPHSCFSISKLISELSEIAVEMTTCEAKIKAFD